MGSSQQFSLRWNNYLKHITCAFDTLRTDEDLVDVTLSCEGKRIRAHKMLLSACSTYFRDLFKENPCQHPVIIFRNVKFDDLAALVDFMYQGEVNVVQEQLASFLTTAELLAVQGLTDGTGKDNDSVTEEDVELPNEPEVQLQNAAGKLMANNKGSKSPSSPMPFHSIELQPDIPPTKRRKYRDSGLSNAEKSSSIGSKKDLNDKLVENQVNASGSNPVEIIPLMPNLKLEMPEYLEQDGSSCSYEEQSTGDGSTIKISDDVLSNTADEEHKPDISQTFYSSQSTDISDAKHSTAEIGHLLSKPSTSSERISQEAVQDPRRNNGSDKFGPDADLHSSSNDNLDQTSKTGIFRCRICPKTFKHPISLALHKNVHAGQTKCPYCQHVFSRSYNMRKHILYKHKYTL
ncbi:broad-complex core protein isoforms 1/2/3/4/5-like isoform X4 [Microplitis mediator]|uniref:broad-complex core protein isoforms 1/2/3/4/5-like isoform X4 n=1 Tax=Microplitis mediator TaxID=375433 RepID=UPI0025548215|nr:broad-complex core protein isoforms 1/2/3/4/5-like isoform X4 [Microplitis mediator]